MSTADPFHSPKQRLARAKEHIEDLEAAIKALTADEPYANVVEMDADGVTQLHKIKMIKPLPDRLSVLTHDAIEALRHTLDQAGYACAVLTGKSNPKSTYFPFADSGTELAKVIGGRCKDLPSDIVSLFRSFQPYKGGNDALWAMNKVAGAKHTVLIPVGMASTGFTARSMTATTSSLGSVAILIPQWDGAKQEMIFGRVGPGAKLDYDVEFSFYVAFGDAPVFARQPVLAVLHHLAGEVTSILDATEAECRRIGLLT